MLEAKNIKPITAAVDVWAAGVLAYELVCGRPPFEVEDEVKTVTRIIYGTDIRFPEGFSPALTDFVTHALTKDPARRPNAHMLMSHPWCAHLPPFPAGTKSSAALNRLPSNLIKLPLINLRASPNYLPVYPLQDPGQPSGGHRVRPQPAAPPGQAGAAAPTAHHPSGPAAHPRAGCRTRGAGRCLQPAPSRAHRRRHDAYASGLSQRHRTAPAAI